MRNAILYTKTPLEMDKCLEQIKIMYKGARGNEYQIHLGKPPKCLYVWFPSTDLSDPIEALDMVEDIDKIPFEHPYFTHIDFHLLNTLQNVLKTISTLYPEMMIWTDDDKFYTCEEFLNTTFDF